MLNIIQILVAFVAVMLSVSLLITIVNQFVSSTFGIRGAALRDGLRAMLLELHPELRFASAVTNNQKGTPTRTGQQHAAVIVDAVLTDPLVSDSAFSWRLPFFGNRWTCATAIRFDELSRTLNKMADPYRVVSNDPRTWDPIDAKTWLARNLSATQDWFDSTMNRVKQTFAMQMHVLTVCIAILIAFGLHLDSIDLIHRISQDSDLRQKLNARADALVLVDPNAAQKLGDIKKGLDDAGFQLVPADLGKHYSASALTNDLLPWNAPEHFLGVMLTAALLSLGSPFWFNLLKSLVNLRSTVAQVEETERMQRQQTASASAPSPATAPAVVTVREF